MENPQEKNEKTANTSLPNYQNPFMMHFHAQTGFEFNPNSFPAEKKLVIEPNQIEFPPEINPRHKSLTEDVEEFKHFRNVIASFLNYKVLLFFVNFFYRIK